jgi:hypothetical protein
MTKKIVSAAMGAILAFQAVPSTAATFADQSASTYEDFLSYLQAQLAYTGSLDTLLKQMGADQFAGWSDFQTASANLKAVLSKMISEG